MSSTMRQDRPVRRPDVWVRKTVEENVLYDPESGAVHLLNETALAIWELCDGETRADEMIEAICDLFGMHQDVVVEDVERICGDFEKASLINWVAAGTGE